MLKRINTVVDYAGKAVKLLTGLRKYWELVEVAIKTFEFAQNEFKSTELYRTLNPDQTPTLSDVPK